MKKTFLLLFTLLLSHSLLGQDEKGKTEFSVINILGAKVYEQPTFASKVLTEIPIGGIIQPERSIETNEAFAIGKGFFLSGKWIKPMDINGFVFSSDLSSKKVETGTSDYGQEYINLLGELISEQSEEKKIKTEIGEFPQYCEYKYYENGKYSLTIWDGCFDHMTEYQNLTLNEVYHQMVSDYGLLMNGKDFLVPEFQEKAGNILKFEGLDATQDLKIELKENGIFVVTSYSCD